MRILHVINSLDPAGGGPPAVATRLAAAQAALGHEVSLLTYTTPGREETIAHSLQPIPHFRSCRIIRLPAPNTVERLAATGTKNGMRASPFASGCDIMHLHGVWESILRVAAHEARDRGIPYVVRPAGMLDPWSLRQSRWKKRLALMLGHRRLLDDAAFLQALSVDEAHLMEPLGLRCRVEVIPNGVFIEEIQPMPASGSFSSKHRQLMGRPFILFLGRLHYKKGLDYLADAFISIAVKRSELMLVVAGPDGGGRAKFESQIAAAGLASRVLLVGPLYGRDKLEALGEAACFCLPSRQEGFSVAIIEALGCGVPVVISDNCHFREVAKAGAGEVVELHPQAIAAALLRVTGNEAERRCMGLRGRDLVRLNYSWPKIAEQTITAYRRAGARDSPPCSA